MAVTGSNGVKFFYVVEEPLKLLFVDDDPILREFALVHLASDRGSISVAGDGEEALAAIARDCPDLVLLDLQMPKVNGFAVLQALRADPATERLPVIVITARDDVQSIDRAFSEGATSFLVKPINWRQLAYQIRYVDRTRRIELSLLEHAAEVEQRRRDLEATSTELATALRNAAAASEAKSQFLAAMSHELRTPLNAVIGFSQLLESESLGPLGNPRYREYAGNVLSSGTHLLSLVDDVLEFSSTSLDKVALADDEFVVADVIDEALRIVFPQVTAANLSASRDAGCEALSVRGDYRRIRRVLLNLLSNAVKFTPSGGQVTVRTRQSAAGLAIAVSDTGIGIAGDDIAKVLEPFGRVDNSYARKHDGVGLGLPIARQCIELHGGSLQFESVVGEGTTVTLMLPPDRVCPVQPGLS